MNIIGEHTDYAGGLALPFTINSRLELEANFSATEYIGDDTIIELWKEAGGPVAELKHKVTFQLVRVILIRSIVYRNRHVCHWPSRNMQTCLLAQQIEHRVLGTNADC